MTSRPPPGVQQRQPQRTLSGNGLPQRPPHQRSLSSQTHLPPPPPASSSPIRKDQYIDLTTSSPDSSDAATTTTTTATMATPPTMVVVGQGRNAAFKRTGSRLKLELSNEAITEAGLSESPGALESGRVFTPSRVMAPTDVSELGDMSPRLPAGLAHTADNGSADTAVRLPMPPRRMRFTQQPLPGRGGRPTTTTTTAAVAAAAAPTQQLKKDGRPKPWSVEVPTAAPHYVKQPRKGDAHGRSSLAGSSSMGGGIGIGSSSSNSSSAAAAAARRATTGYADFFPWTGDHPEDQFSESVIRQGFFDKAPIAQTETSSAKALIFPMLKHKTGLHMLSQIFTSVLGQRRFNGQITAESQFKLPPRVTVTDTKREGWLKDLAKPEIPLRRLSRTIPHGVRGKNLLDQCLNKNIPLDRAVWLARCVGAQELRAFKRKGAPGSLVVAGEAKWIREWTVCIEQFIETRISALSETDWKQKMHYSIRLATSLFAEHLLDREHYMDWLLTSLESSQHPKLPIWLLLTQIYWKDLLSMRRSGRRLVNALLSHQLAIQSIPDKDILQPLSSRLTSLITTLLVNGSENFISPGTWPKYRDSLSSSIPAEPSGLRALFKSVKGRNEQLAANSIRSQPAARNTMVKQLDSSLQSPISDEFPQDCWNITKDKPTLVKTLLEWCTSLYRPGIAKVYVTVRLLTSWSAFGVDATAALLDFFDADPLAELERKSICYHLASELVRRGLFNIPRYVQWLIARGGLSEPGAVAQDGRVTSRLLAELPTHAMSDSLKILRANMLRLARYQVEHESKDVAMAIMYLKQTLGLPLDANDPMAGKKPMPITKLSNRIRLSSRSLKADLCAWLRNSFVCLEKESKDRKQSADITPSTFNAVRAALEAAADYTMLADVLKVVAGMSNVEVLGSCADTLNLHISTFAAMGVARDLFDLLYGRLKTTVEEQGIGARPLLAALANLAPRIPGLEELGSQLHKDLIRSDRSMAVDACSPVSDNMAARLQDSEGELHEEIEKLLSTGTSLDKNTMERLFGTVVPRLQGCWDKADGGARAYAMLLARLRLFDAQHFDMIMTKWLRSVRSSVAVLHVFPMLASLECLSIPLILSTVSDEGTQASIAAKPGSSSSSSTPAGPSLVQNTWRSKYVQQVLQLMAIPIPRHPLLTEEECYRFSIKQSQARKAYSNELLALIRNSLAEYSMCRQQGEQQSLPLDDLGTQAHVQELLQSLVLMDSASVARALAVKNADPAVGHLIETTTTQLLMPNCPAGTQVSFDDVLELTNEFTLPFCQLKLSSSLALGDSTGPDASERAQSHLELFAKAMDKAIDAKNITWTGMLSCLGPEITQHLKNRAQARFFELIPSAKTAAAAATNSSSSSNNNGAHLAAAAASSQPPPPPETRTLEQSVQMADNLLAVVDAIIRGGSMGRPPQLIPLMMEKLADVWEVLATGDAPARAAVVRHWLPNVLTFLTLHTATFDASKASNDVRAKGALVLAGIMQELDSLPPAVDELLLHSSSSSSSSLSSSSSSSPSSTTDQQQQQQQQQQPPLQQQQNRQYQLRLKERVFDLAMLLVDNLAEESRMHCVRIIRDATSTSDPRLRYLFSFALSPTEHLVLSHRDKSATATATATTPGLAGSAATGSTGAIPARSIPQPLQPPTPTAVNPGAVGGPGSGMAGGGTSGIWGPQPPPERLSRFVFRRWEIISDPNPTVQENDSSLNMSLFEAIKL